MVNSIPDQSVTAVLEIKHADEGGNQNLEEAKDVKTEGYFSETKKKIQGMLQISLLIEARVIIEEYIIQNLDSSSQDNIEELSHVYLTYVKVLSKMYQLAPLWKVFKENIEPLLKVAVDQHNVESEARLLYAAQIISTTLIFKENTQYIDKIKKLYSEN